jgi:hypothetical protein
MRPVTVGSYAFDHQSSYDGDEAEGVALSPAVRGKLGQLQAMDFPADSSRLDAFLETFAAA